MNAFQSWALILGLWANVVAWWVYFDLKADRRG